jgi:hypothetical protein
VHADCWVIYNFYGPLKVFGPARGAPNAALCAGAFQAFTG